VFNSLDEKKQSHKTKADEKAILSGTPSEHRCFKMIDLHHLDKKSDKVQVTQVQVLVLPAERCRC